MGPEKEIRLLIQEGHVDSMYRLVLVAARRANQVAKPETRALVPTTSARKPTMVALDEIVSGKVSYRIGSEDEEEFVE